jgi:hypothetical protein
VRRRQDRLALLQQVLEPLVHQVARLRVHEAHDAVGLVNVGQLQRCSAAAVQAWFASVPKAVAI